jgi:hypothetical protein
VVSYVGTETSNQKNQAFQGKDPIVSKSFPSFELIPPFIPWTDKEIENAQQVRILGMARRDNVSLAAQHANSRSKDTVRKKGSRRKGNLRW